MRETRYHTKGKIWRIQHLPTVMGKTINILLLPLGYKYNADLLKAKCGDTLVFSNGKRHYIYKAGSIDISSRIADILAIACYGRTIEKILTLWKNEMSARGYGREAISINQCLVIGYGREIKKESTESVPNEKVRGVYKIR